MKQRVPNTSKSSKLKGETQHYVVKLPKAGYAKQYCPKILQVPGTLGTRANSSPDVRYLDEILCKNELFGRALQIIQDEEYLDDVDFDEIKRRKRQSPFIKNQSEDKTMEVFKEGLNRNEMKPKIQIHREKRQLAVDTILNSHNDLDLRYALPKEKQG